MRAGAEGSGREARAGRALPSTLASMLSVWWKKASKVRMERVAQHDVREQSESETRSKGRREGRRVEMWSDNWKYRRMVVSFDWHVTVWEGCIRALFYDVTSWHSERARIHATSLENCFTIEPGKSVHPWISM